eukprot:TRINITY_DN80916_c0_g1_i1.p1 TRINITY_DN80916_c0_g1~~TRINITY_DN80916_c0_g1_i1.p1  ORF type:complete len:321 (-),score=53.00 TRINITY_DN80916_c0_g1_i1:382-1344(-)
MAAASPASQVARTGPSQRRVQVVGLSYADVAALPATSSQAGHKRWHAHAPCLSPTTLETPSEENRLLVSLPTSCTSSTLSASEAEDQGPSSRGGLSTELEDVGVHDMQDEGADMSEDSDDDDATLPTTPSKSARRRLRRRRQAQAIKAAADHARAAAWHSDTAARPARAVVTLGDIGLDLLSPTAGGSSASTAIVASGEVQVSPAMPSKLGTSAARRITLAEACCMTSPTPCRSSWTAPLGTSPCEAALLCGDAAARTPQSQNLGYVNAALPPAMTSPARGERPQQTAHAMRLLFGDVAPPSPEVLAAQLRVAAPEVYED